MSSSLKRASRSIKREADDGAGDSALGDEEYKHSRRSPQKTAARAKRGHDDDESEEDDDYDDEMNSFIDDEEVEQEQDESYDALQSRKKKRKKARNFRVDDEDREIVRENVGIEIAKKKRLNRLAERERGDNSVDDKALVKKEIEVAAKREAVKIDTSRQRIDYRAEMRRDQQEEMFALRQIDNSEKLRQMQNVFGAADEELELPLPSGGITQVQAAPDAQMEDMFPADEVDDPFSTKEDKVIESTDICERLQVRLKSRMRPDDAELHTEAEWIFDRLSIHSTLVIDPETQRVMEPMHKYSMLLRKKDAKSKIFRVLQLLRQKLYDVPMIAHHRKHEYSDELDEESIWIIYALDQEYGKFLRQKRQIQDYLSKITQINPQMRIYEEELRYSKNMSELNNFNSLISFLNSYYAEALAASDANSSSQPRKKQPLKRDEVQIALQGKIDNFASHFSLTWTQFVENIERKQMIHVPPGPTETPKQLAQRFINDQYQSENKVHQGVCKFAAIELSAQPPIRNAMKNNIKEHATVTTELTEQGKKDLDLFHPSYRVKCVRKRPLKELMSSNDLYLDIMQCEKAGLVSVKFEIDQMRQENFKNFLKSLYMQNHEGSNDSWNILRTEIIELLCDKLLMRELEAELRDEIREEAETFVIAKCKEIYRKLLMTGPFTTKEAGQGDDARYQDDEPKRSGWKTDNEIVKDRERICVMGAIMHQIDANNYVVTVAIVDKFGELVQTRDFMRLIRPRKRQNQAGRDSEQIDGRPQPKSEEDLQQEQDKKKLITMLEECRVDLITVAANCLEARTLKTTLQGIAGELKNKAAEDGQADPVSRKEVLTIWGSTEVPKLFSMSHNSQRLHKNMQQMYKQAISLARFEQDPLCELLNLWSPITAENQALALSLDPMQKWVNQARLADGLEEVNIQVVNEIGIDINLVCDHEHMHSLLQFISGFGPRKAKKFISKMKGMGTKLTTRSDILRSELLGQEIYISAVAFLRIRVPDEDLQSKGRSTLHILDQTRIHHESYKLTMKIARDTAQGETELDQEDKAGTMHQLREIMANPAKVKSLDLEAYKSELIRNEQQHLFKIIDKIVKELQNPFGDPREYRSFQRQNMSNERLFYLLIEESKRTFKRGIIVTATVTKVFESKAICRLDNGLNAIIQSSAILEEGVENVRLQSVLEFGRIITGRIERIVIEEENKFEVQLTVKKNALASHENYKRDLAFSLGIDPDQIDSADLKNHHYSTDQRHKHTGRFIPRNIAHEKFKNISSRRAISELNELETGDFFFRPSTRSEDRITLTWKFWKNHYVHIDIIESNKPKGAAIGSTLIISNDYYFESLREIVERYIIPCNRLVREVVGHQKFSDAKTFEDLETRLKDEKREDPARIPYRFAILPNYPQHVVLSYVPKEKVLKEFIKVRPKGFYFHEVNHQPFQILINWFKDNWRTQDYQKHLRRQRSPRVQQTRPSTSEAGPGALMKGDGNNSTGFKQQNWGGGDVSMKQERAGRSPGYGYGSSSVKQEGAAALGNWGGDTKMQDSHADDDRRGRGGGGGGGSRACFKCNEEGHIARDCPNQDQRPPRRPIECFKCNQEGHMARDCPNQAADGGRGGRGRACFKCNEEGHIARDCPSSNGGDAYKRPRREDDDGGYSRPNAGEPKGSNNAWGNAGNADWNTGMGATGGWGENNQ